jgi:hypothetical protein
MRRASDSGIVVVESGPQMQRGSAMLFFFLTTEVFWGFRS